MKNFMLYKDFHEKFKDKDIIGILAEYKNNPRKSNRGGKSTITEAIKYCLFGMSRAKKDIDLIHHGEEVMWVEVGLVDDGKKFTVKRGRDHKNKGLLECDWIDKKKEAQEEINRIVGCNGEELELTNFFKQSDINQFMELGPNKKKEHFMKWFKQLHWPKLADAVGEDLKEKKSELSQQRTKKETLIEELSDIDDVQKQISETEKAIKKQQKLHDKYVLKHRKLLKKVKTKKDKDDIQEQLEEVELEIEEIQEQVEANKELIRAYKKTKQAVSDLEEDIKKETKFHKKLLSDYRDVLAQAKQERKQVLKTLEQVGEKFCGVCPILNEGCDRIKTDPAQIKKMNKRVKELDAECQQFEEKIEQQEQAREAQEALNNLQNKAKLQRDRVKAIKSPEKKLEALQAKFESLTKQLEEPEDSLEDRLEELSEKIKKINTGLDTLNRKLGQFQSTLVRHKKTKKKISTIDEGIKVLESEIESLKYLAFMFGKNGIPSQEIENAFQDIEEEINFILEKLGTTLEVTFNADRELGGWEPECVGCGWRFPKGYRKNSCEQCGETRQRKRKDELHLSVTENGNEMNFEMESGGGKTFVSLAVRIALTRLMQKLTGSNFNVLFLDEIDSALDEDARENIMKLVTTVLMKDFGFQQIFWISHDKKIKDNLPHTLKVIRGKNEAKATWT